ncbi:hypothetical protein L873DRAFT_1823824 [Choiromyces venosus 120613-1]|uniref:Uncharacterized protein n=1 Tax=Choiromyces venosus 120613-1 TaxID=1336337 RepID=A0A3N4IT12_9PEZI|nr:hypothetical protein L873DRAFT_1823824 [Choiromyces venosus 120613-1]
MTMLEGRILAQLMGFLSNVTGRNKDFDLALVQFEKHFPIPQKSMQQFVQEQSQEIQKLFSQMQEVAMNYML